MLSAKLGETPENFKMLFWLIFKVLLVSWQISAYCKVDLLDFNLFGY